MEYMSLRIYNAAQEYANARGFLIADTKFEFGLLWYVEKLILADEVLTPDSSRIWHLEQWREAQKSKKSPPGYDKQPVRDYFAEAFKGRDPTNPADLEFAAGLEVPVEIVESTMQRYLQIFEALTGQSLPEF
jgi:phosphoribosylaminoimidazole-succinocarboxamide synthase